MTPPIIRTIPIAEYRLNKSPHITIPTITVSAVPTPDHIAYARLSGNVFKHRDNEKNESPYPNPTAIDGPKMVNPSESLSIVVANTSLIIDNVKNR